MLNLNHLDGVLNLLEKQGFIKKGFLPLILDTHAQCSHFLEMQELHSTTQKTIAGDSIYCMHCKLL